MQQSFKFFDGVTPQKVLKGMLMAALSAGAIAALQYLGAVHIDNPTLAAFVAWAVPTMVNTIREYVKGA